jgi:predicted nucleic acid-binding Zn ribbon protein
MGEIKMQEDRKTDAPVLNETESRQARRVGLIWVLAGSLALVVIVGFFLAGYF